MLLQIKTLSNEKFAVECELTDSVRTVKEKIAAKNLKDNFEADAMKLIFSGKILEDTKTLESYSISQDSFLVVVKQPAAKPAASLTTPAATPASSSAASTNTPSSSTPTATPTNAPTSATGSTVPQSAAAAAPAPAARSQPSAVLSLPADSFLSTENREKALRELTEMGFERTQAEAALRASFYNVERAAEYLITGNIPTFTDAPTQQQGNTGSGQTPSDTESTSSGRRAPIDDLASLSNNPQFLALRQLIQQNPEQLQTLMQTLQANQPELFQMIEQHPREFLELLNQVDDDDGDDDDPTQGGAMDASAPGLLGPPGTVTITLTPQDQLAINRLQDMGFDRNRVIEAFIACDRNEELAANYLLSSFD